MNPPIPKSPIIRPRQLIRDQVYAHLAQEIATGRLAPQDEINDQELQDAYGVSRTPIREALMRLADIGLVELSSNRFTRVATLDLHRQADRAEAAGALVAQCVATATPRLDDAQRHVIDQRIQAILDSDMSLLGMPEGIKLSFALWTEFIEISGNAVIAEFLDKNLILHLSRSTQVRPLPGWMVEQQREALRQLKSDVAQGEASKARETTIALFQVAAVQPMRAAAEGEWRSGRSS